MVLNPTSGFQPGDPTEGLESPGNLTLKASGIWLQDFHRTVGNGDSSLEGYKQNLLWSKTQRNAAVTTTPNPTTGDWSKTTCWCWRVSCVGVGQQKLTTGGGEEAAAVSEGPPWCKPSWRSPVTRPRAHRPKRWIGLGQNTTREGTQSHPSADNWIKAVLSKALPTRARPVFPTTSPSHQEAYTRLSISGQTEEARRTTIPLWLKQKPHYRKLISMKKQEVVSRWRDKIKPQENN